MILLRTFLTLLGLAVFALAADDTCTLQIREARCEGGPLTKSECLALKCCQWSEMETCDAAFVIPDDGEACCADTESSSKSKKTKKSKSKGKSAKTAKSDKTVKDSSKSEKSGKV